MKDALNSAPSKCRCGKKLPAPVHGQTIAYSDFGNYYGVKVYHIDCAAVF